MSWFNIFFIFKWCNPKNVCKKKWEEASRRRWMQSYRRLQFPSIALMRRDETTAYYWTRSSKKKAFLFFAVAPAFLPNRYQILFKNSHVDGNGQKQRKGAIKFRETTFLHKVSYFSVSNKTVRMACCNVERPNSSFRFAFRNDVPTLLE